MADTITAAARRSLRTALLALLLGAAFTLTAQQAHAYPPAGSDTVPVTATVSFTSRLGQETILFSGIVTISRSDPYMNGGVEVVDVELTSLALSGNSITGPVTITPSTSFQSLGEIRSDQPGQDWPASAYLDVFVEVAAPASPTTTISKHNEVAIQIVPMIGGSPVSISSWPPLAVPWEADLSPCVTSLSMLFNGVPSGEEVGGLAELARIGGADAGNPGVAGGYVLAVLGTAIALLGAFWFMRRRPAS